MLEWSRRKKMFNERINYNVRICEKDSEIPVTKLQVDGKGKATFKVKTYLDFINARVSFDLVMGYYIVALNNTNQGVCQKIANAEIGAMGTERVNTTFDGEFIAEDIMFIGPGEYVLELYVCERPDVDESLEEFDYRKKAYMVSSFFFEV